MDSETLDRYGYYVVSGKKYYNKLEAFKVAFSQGHHPHWHFHEDTFSDVDWQIEPNESLEQLYANRAQQIRDKYQTVILSFSGGSDSSTVADSFIDNDIPLDYLLNRTVREILSRRDDGTDEENFHNESVFSAYPKYLIYKEKQPHLKFVTYNYSDYMIKFWNDAKDVNPYDFNNFSPNLIVKDNILEIFKEHNDSCCIIHAIDKPMIFYINGRFYITFMDEFFHQQIPSSVNHFKKNITTECFFWSKESTKLLIKQAHVLKKFFKSNPAMLSLISKFPHRPDADFYRKIVTKCCYHPSKLDMWQPQKATYKWILGSENWFFYSDIQAAKNWRNWYKSVESEANSIFEDKSLIYVDNVDHNKLFGEKLFNGLPGCYSKFYDLGE